MISDYTSNPSGLPYIQKVVEHFTPELQWSQDMMIGIILKGNLTLNYGSHIRSFNEHDIFFFLPFQTFSVITASEDAKILILSVDTGFLKKLVPDFSLLTLQQHHLGRDLRNETYYQLCYNFSNIIFNNLKQDTCSRFKMLNAITNMLTIILENYGVKSEETSQHHYATDRIMDILNYINEHYAEKITVNDISSHLGIHPQYFSSFFSKHFHSSFVEYLTAFRINASLNRLIYSNDSILDIALANGFSNHKTYAAAFRKLYQMSPTDYRKNHQHFTSDEFDKNIESDTENDYNMFSYFRQFLLTDNSAQLHRNRIQRKQLLSFEPEKLLPGAQIKEQEHFYTIGRAFACLRNDLQMQIIQAQKDLHIEHFRVRDIFSDSLYIYYETETKEPLFHWQALDTVFDFILSTGAKPFPEIGYMPEKLASKKQYAGLQFHPNISSPKSMEKWQALIRSFLLHYIQRYGCEEVTSWYFDFWTSPDLELKMSYWNDSMEDFFEFYRATYEVFQEVNPDLKLGTPNFSTISGFPWYEAFFQYCHDHQINPAYISMHAYGCITKKDSQVSRDFNDIDSNDFSITNQNQVSDFLATLHEIMDHSDFAAKEVIVSDFNLNFMPSDLIRDTCYMGPYLAHSTFRTLNQVKSLGHWCLSDIHEDAYPKDNLFWGGPGLITYHGLKKASYNALSLLDRLGDVILEQGENYLFTQKGNMYQIFIYNLIEFDYFYSHMDKSALDDTHRYNIFSNTEELYLNIIITLPKGTYYIKKLEVNQTYGSSYDIWGQMGYPESFSKDMEDYLRESSVPHVTYSVQDVENALIIDETVPAHGIMLLEVQRKE